MNKNLILRIKTEFRERFKGDPILIASPGRINLIGEHTDYNKGFVFPAAIDKYIFSAFAKSQYEVTRIYSLDLDQMLKIDLHSLERQKPGHWSNYVIGVVHELQKTNKKIQNFDLVFGGDIPIGAGLSSSAALENSIVFGLNTLFDLKLSKAEMIQISMQAEHNFAGVKCGIMDQFSSIMGKSNQAMLLNCEDLSFEYIPIEMKDYEIILINSNVKHSLANSAYNQRRKECNEGLKILQEKFPKLNSLAQITMEQLLSTKDELSPTNYNRCLYVFEENKRVVETKKAIELKDWKKVGKLLFESHHGLQYLYEVSCAELDFLVDQVRENEAVIGSRMMGGGFGGCTLSIVKKNSRAFLEKTITEEYFKKFGFLVNIYSIKISEGTKLIEI